MLSGDPLGQIEMPIPRACTSHSPTREELKKPNRNMWFLAGDARELNRFLQLSRFKSLNVEIVIAQPGLSKDTCTSEQTAVLAAADSFLLETVGVKLNILCSE